MMMPTELYQSLLPHYGRNISFSQGRRHSQPTKCTRCGTAHMELQLCKATNRKCYKCRRYGHFANFCSLQETSKNDNSKDLKMMTGNDIEQPSPINVSTISSDPVQDLKSKLEDSNKHLLSVQVECGNLKSECSNLLLKNEELSEQVKHLNSCLSDSEKNTEQYESQLETLFKFAVELHQCIEDYSHLAEHLTDEYNQLAVGYLVPYPDNKPSCHKCRSYSHFGKENCPANGWHCCKCGKRNHFAAACDSDILPEFKTDDKTSQLLAKLQQSTGIQLEKEINCIMCDDSDESDENDDSDDESE